MSLKTTWLCFLTFITLVLVVFFVIGKFEPNNVFDTVGYIKSAESEWPTMLEMPRAPFFGIFLNLFDTYEGIRPALDGAERTLWENENDRFLYYPIFVILIYFISAALLFYAFSAYGLSVKAASSISFGLIISNSLILYGNILHPELLSISLIILSIAGTVLLSSEKKSLITLILTALCVVFAYLIKPAFITFIVFIPLIYFILNYRYKGRFRQSLILFLLCLFPFLLVSSLRYYILGDFNIVSFGGFQMTGIAALMLDSSIIPNLPDELIDVANNILDKKKALIENSNLIALPKNSSGEVSFISVALGYYDILARNYDAVIYGIMGDLKMPTESWVEFNSRMQNFTIQVISSQPVYYICWIIGATARFLGRSIVMNLPLMLSVIGLFLVLLVKPLPKIINLTFTRDEMICLILIPLIFAFSSGFLSILVSFPAARYIDSSNVMLSGIIIFLLQLLLDDNSQIFKTK
jgi:hypothetical protein